MKANINQELKDFVTNGKNLYNPPITVKEDQNQKNIVLNF